MLFLASLSRWVQRSFVLWIVLFAVIAFFKPAAFVWLTAYIPWVLGIIMLGMGMSLSLDEFKQVMSYPKAILIGVVAHFVVMPGLAYLLCQVFQLPPEIAIGVILVGCCPGGTASNVITFMAKGNTALSVACTTVSTILAPILTPSIFYFLAREWIQIEAGAMLVSILQVVLLPILLGVILQHFFKSKIKSYIQLMPLVSVIGIVLMVAAIIAASKASILQSGFIILLVVILHNGLGYVFGYWSARCFKLSYSDAKAISIEVGMQNSGLGVALAAVHFAASPITAVPSAIFSLWHNISGALLATYWASKAKRQGHNANDVVTPDLPKH